jgi:Protein ChrB, N-terminal
VVTIDDSRRSGRWVLLCYRLPREPSTPRIAVWRKLKRLGVGQLVDGLVALPADARTREQLEWIAQEIGESGGEASVWLARPGSLDHEAQIAARMTQARTLEYRDVIVAADEARGASERERRRTVDRLNAELRRIGRRDFFPTAERDLAHAAVRSLLSVSRSGEVIAG